MKCEEAEAATKKPKRQPSWEEFCTIEAESIRHGKRGFDAETKQLIPVLTELTRLGFYTCSSQPTHGGAHEHQRAYVSGYMPAKIRTFLLEHTPRDIIIWQSMDSITITAFDGDWPGKTMGLSWCGEICMVDDVEPYRPAVVPFHAVDTRWERSDLYLFDQILAGIKRFHAEETEAAQWWL